MKQRQRMMASNNNNISYNKRQRMMAIITYPIINRCRRVTPVIIARCQHPLPLLHTLAAIVFGTVIPTSSNKYFYSCFAVFFCCMLLAVQARHFMLLMVMLCRHFMLLMVMLCRHFMLLMVM